MSAVYPVPRLIELYSNEFPTKQVAFREIEEMELILHVPSGLAFRVKDFDGIYFPDVMNDYDVMKDETLIAFDGSGPESLLEHYVGMRPEAVIAGFDESVKPEGFEWTPNSTIVEIFNYRGTVMMRLERIQGDAK